MKNWLRVLLPVLLIVGVIGGFGSPALAATSQNITVVYTPAFVSINISNTTWEINNYTGDNLVRPSTTYYSNPLGDDTSPSATVTDGECFTNIGNDGSVSVNLTVDFLDFSGGTDPMTNSNSGSGGVGSFGAYTYWSGETFASKTIAQSSGSSEAYGNLAASSNVMMGFEFATQTDDMTGATQSTATVTIIATES